MPPVVRRSIIIYADENGEEPFTKWYQTIKDNRIRDRIDRTLDRIKDGNLGDHRPIINGNGVQEFRFRFGGEYRVYFAEDGQTVIILLGAGDKKTQKKDISKAINHWLTYLKRKDHE